MSRLITVLRLDYRQGGGSEREIRTIFDQARLYAPCILVVEDLDAMLEEGNQSVFLNEMDGLVSLCALLRLSQCEYSPSYRLPTMVS